MNHRDAIEAASGQIGPVGGVMLGPIFISGVVRAYLTARADDDSFVVLADVINVMAGECATALLADFDGEAT